jgi:hypothetical protein
MLNARPGTLIWGEGGRALIHFQNLLVSAAAFSRDSEKLRRHYLYNRASTNDLSRIQNLTPAVEHLESHVIKATRTYFGAYKLPGFDLVGMKEVGHEIEHLRLFRSAFPGAFIFGLFRNPVHCWRSIPQSWRAMQALTPETFIETWNRRLEAYRTFSKSDRNACLLFYEDIIERHEPTMETICKVGRISSVAVEDVMAVKMVSHADSYSVTDDEARIIQNTCAENRFSSYRAS